MKTYYISYNRYEGRYVKYSSKEQAALQGIEVEEIEASNWADACNQYRDRYIGVSDEE